MTRETIMSVLTIVGMAVATVTYVNSLERRIAVLEVQLTQNAKDDAEQAGFIDRLWDVVQPPKVRAPYKAEATE